MRVVGGKGEVTASTVCSVRIIRAVNNCRGLQNVFEVCLGGEDRQAEQ